MAQWAFEKQIFLLHVQFVKLILVLAKELNKVAMADVHVLLIHQREIPKDSIKLVKETPPKIIDLLTKKKRKKAEVFRYRFS